MTGEYDFTRDGIPEELALITVIDPNGVDVSWYELWVEQEGNVLLREEFSTAHAGWNTVLACKVEGKDYLLRYYPYMIMGIAGYSYTLFVLDENGTEVEVAENSTLLLSTEPGDLWSGMSGEDFFRESGSCFDLPEDMNQWEQYLVDYQEEFTAIRTGE